MAIKIAGTEVINDNRELVLAKLTEINSSISSTAVDVFIYDTSKDSDGGAWRHRTQHTSWYAEASSASRDPNTRSTRAEFPAVAVIVAESNKVTIYDGDDPSLPMWMVFNASGSQTAVRLGVVSVAMKNGKLICGSSSSRGLQDISFVEDRTFLRSIPEYERGYTTIVDRNISGSYVSVGGTSIVNATVNDVAMTVLPDAPTDPATGLPVPTIAVATDGGVSVIKDDGTVVDITASAGNSWASVSFASSGRLFAYHKSVKDLVALEIPSADYVYSSGSNHFLYNEVTQPPVFHTSSYLGSNNILPTAAGDYIALSRREATSVGEGVSLLYEDPTTQANGMVAYTTSSYATGWMNGDIKLAALADTTAETLSGTPLLDDDFSTYADTAAMKAAGWSSTSSTGTGDISLVSGAMQLDSNGTANRARGSRSFTTVSGKTYVVEYLATGTPTTNHHFRVGTAENGTQSLNALNRPAGSLVSTFVATGTTTYVTWEGFTAVGNETQIDNVSVRLADPDRSVNGNGLAVHGSITKAAVATGADVVGYSGFSSSNYLEQPYNSDLDFGAYTGTAGTGDFCVMGWVKGASSMSTATIVSRCSSISNGFHLFKNTTTTTPYARFRIGSTYLDGTTGIADQWNHLVAMRKDGVAYIYKNGVLENSASISTDVSGSFATEIGWSTAQTTVTGLAGISLFRISATAPTADQIRKIYEDEKVLFQPNAKATLTGNSDAVTALAHDPDTDLLHVGTSGGRSVFQGLRRVEEHTGTDSQSLAAISAVDGLVVEGK